ncbi:uncharacterized protein LOC142829029 [Pelodiscus sinensis]|uniref:uncharacterized protein LOC142829029 n=1 Tax=Pelodiscus sinensis TaxID=13735 RepID=UPI003F6B2E90
MRRDTFLELCEWLAPALRRRDTRMRPAIPLQKRVAIALWKLSTPDSYRSVGNQFGMGRFTIGAVLMQVVKAINRVLLRRVVRLADPDAVIRGFGALGFPNCGGAIEGTHIPIRAPEHQASRYVNRKGQHGTPLLVLRETSSDSGNCIILELWDEQPWWQNFHM